MAKPTCILVKRFKLIGLMPAVGFYDVLKSPVLTSQFYSGRKDVI